MNIDPLAPVWAHAFVRKQALTAEIYQAMQKTFTELKFGQPKLTWEQMWKYYDLLDPNHTNHIKCPCRDILPYHLLINLQKNGHEIYFKLEGNAWLKYK